MKSGRSNMSVEEYAQKFTNLRDFIAQQSAIRVARQTNDDINNYDDTKALFAQDCSLQDAIVALRNDLVANFKGEVAIKSPGTVVTLKTRSECGAAKVIEGNQEMSELAKDNLYNQLVLISSKNPEGTSKGLSPLGAKPSGWIYVGFLNGYSTEVPLTFLQVKNPGPWIIPEEPAAPAAC